MDIRKAILAAKKKAIAGRTKSIEPAFTGKLNWPIECTVGPGLEGAIACETKIGYVNGSNGSLLYQGYDIFDLAAYSTFEEVSYLLLYGRLPSASQLSSFKEKLVEFRYLPNTLRRMMGVPLEEMRPMAGLRMGTDFMRQRLSWRDSDQARQNQVGRAIAADEDSIPMETMPMGEEHAIYEFKKMKLVRPDGVLKKDDAISMDSCLHLISGLATIAGAIARLRSDKLPIEPDCDLSHAGNFLYMMTGKKPSRMEERIMDIALILHADHGMNASTFASMVVASTMSDIYLSVGAGISALTGPLHGGANEAVIAMLDQIGDVDNVETWVDKKLKRGDKIPGFGHRVYKAYDPRSLILEPLAKELVVQNKDMLPTFKIAQKLESVVVDRLGKEKKVFPNVDFYSGLVYRGLGLPDEMFTPIFAVSRVSGWVARVNEYLDNNRIFRPRAMYTGPLDNKYIPVSKRTSK